jgi:Flp pilus assembly pilin Flp
MKAYALRFLRDEHGQDLIEHTLLIACMAVVSAAIILGAGGRISFVRWGTATPLLS